MTASSVFGVPIDGVTPDMRRQAKVINFATIYGVSPFGLSQQAEIGMKEAAEFIRIYFETYPGFKKFIDETIEFARENGYVKTHARQEARHRRRSIRTRPSAARAPSASPSTRRSRAPRRT